MENELAYIETNYDKDKTYPVTFRLPSKLVGDLKKESENLQISLSTFARQVFDRYVTWEKPCNEVGLIPMARSFLKEVLRSLPDERIKKIARNASKDTLRELILISKGEFTLDCFIPVFNEWLRASLMAHRYEYDGRDHHYVIHHDLGRKWSLYLSELLNSIIKELTKKEPEIKVRKYSLIFHVSTSTSPKPDVYDK